MEMEECRVTTWHNKSTGISDDVYHFHACESTDTVVSLIDNDPASAPHFCGIFLYISFFPSLEQLFGVFLGFFSSFPLLFSKLQTVWGLLQPAASAHWPIFLWLHVCYITAFILHLMCYESPPAYVTMWGLMIALYQLLLTAADLSQWHFLDSS